MSPSEFKKVHLKEALDACAPEKIVRYELRHVPRNTNRRQWKLISRWLREAASATSKMLVNKYEHGGCFKYPQEV